MNIKKISAAALAAAMLAAPVTEALPMCCVTASAEGSEDSGNRKYI